MNQTATTGKVVQVKQVPGFMMCTLEHTVSATSGTFRFEQKITREEWDKVLAFFKWTYDTTKSEAQVRLFVHPEHGWRAWAFPQEANLGMSAKELETHERFGPQRAQFSDAEGWLYFGTVHHHCGTGAFQSSTDEANEKNQDGLHITIGKLNEPVYDFHARLYLGGHKFLPDMDWFWDVGDYKAAIPAVPPWCKITVPDASMMARVQMCLPPPADTAFPEEWRANVIARIVPAPMPYQGGLGYGGHGHGPVGNEVTPYRKEYCLRCQPTTDWDLRKATRYIMAWIPKVEPQLRPNMEEIIKRLAYLEEVLDDHDFELLDICCSSDTLPGALALHLEDVAIKALLKEDKKTLPLPQETDSYDEKCQHCGLDGRRHTMDCALIQSGFGE